MLSSSAFVEVGHPQNNERVKDENKKRRGDTFPRRFLISGESLFWKSRERKTSDNSPCDIVGIMNLPYRHLIRVKNTELLVK